MPIQLITTANPGDADWSTTVATHAIVAAGQGTVLLGATTVVVAVGVAFNGFPVVATLNRVDGVIRVVSAVVAAGNLTITTSAAVNADTLVAYTVLGALA